MFFIETVSFMNHVSLLPCAYYIDGPPEWWRSLGSGHDLGLAAVPFWQKLTLGCTAILWALHNLKASVWRLMWDCQAGCQSRVLRDAPHGAISLADCWWWDGCQVMEASSNVSLQMVIGVRVSEVHWQLSGCSVIGKSEGLACLITLHHVFLHN